MILRDKSVVLLASMIFVRPIVHLRASPECEAAWPTAGRIEFHDKQISMAHGAGGEASRRLVEGLVPAGVLEFAARSRWPMRPRSRPPAGRLGTDHR